ncbi:MAG: Mrp/NBP35 family ATP-binding protein [Alphaproteobacteria bacterium]|nr:Mrp/NBP35 family ATP-binding protein [Alphaproteobacteria bacterium]
MADNQTAALVRAAIANVDIPGGDKLGAYKGLSEIIVTPSAVAFAISVEPGMEGAFGPARADAQRAAEAASGGRKVLVSLTSDKAPGKTGQQAPQAHGSGIPPKTLVNGVKHVVAIASGKGGVGKSTVAVNLALGLKALGRKVGVLDADLYGPSVPRLLGLEGQPVVREDELFTPMSAYGLEAMSIGSMLQGDQAVIWRGPMAASALRQLLRETAWGDLDILIVDLPPGTGDIQLSLCQQVELAGAVIVSTPQDLALIDARKAMDMFKKLSVPLIGLVENMSYFVAPDTGNRYDIFGHGGARSAADELGVPFLGEIPLHMAVREQSDLGAPVTAVMSDGPEAAAFNAIAARLLSGGALG